MCVCVILAVFSGVVNADSWAGDCDCVCGGQAWQVRQRQNVRVRRGRDLQRDPQSSWQVKVNWIVVVVMIGIWIVVWIVCSFVLWPEDHRLWLALRAALWMRFIARPWSSAMCWLWLSTNSTKCFRVDSKTKSQLLCFVLCYFCVILFYFVIVLCCFDLVFRSLICYRSYRLVCNFVLRVRRSQPRLWRWAPNLCAKTDCISKKSRRNSA